MILVVNCLIEEALVESFNQGIARELGALGQPFVCVRVSQLGALGELSTFSHLILSGSEASTTSWQAWEYRLECVVLHFIADGKPVLGICYGHQFLAKTLAGPDHIRTAAAPEFGWLAPSLHSSPLFEGLEVPWFMVCHFDEVHDLPGEFRVLASSPQCAIQAFQYRDLPVFGVQFHPEYGFAEAQVSFDALSKQGGHTIFPPPADHAVLEQSRRIFENFVKLSRVVAR